MWCPWLLSNINVIIVFHCELNCQTEFKLLPLQAFVHLIIRIVLLLRHWCLQVLPADPSTHLLSCVTKMTSVKPITCKSFIFPSAVSALCHEHSQPEAPHHLFAHLDSGVFVQARRMLPTVLLASFVKFFS